MNYENSDSLFARLRETRKTLGLKQDEMAAVCGVSREMWGKYERGAAMPGAEVLGALATHGADVRYVLTGEREGTKPVALTAEERLMLEYFRDASPAIRKAAMAALLSGSGGMSGMNMANLGDGNVQIGSGGSLGGSFRVKKGK